MKKIFITGFLLLATLLTWGQSVTIADNDTLCDCSNPNSIFNAGGTVNFTDAQGAGNYLPNSNDTITLCPDGGASKLSVTFGTNTGYTWDVDASDTLYVYDGPNTSAPLIGAYNSSTDPNGFFVVSSWNNPSGCLTFVFISDGATEGTGWEANVGCANPPQPFEVHMEGFINGQANGGNDLTNDLNPADTGYIDICLGDSVMFVANPVFPYDPSVTGNGGYDQINNYTVLWEATNGFTSTDDTIWFKPTTQSGFLISLTIDDGFPQEQTIMAIVRVSTTPSFATCQALDDTICEGQVTELIGGIIPGDTVGVDPTTGAVEVGGTFATLTYLPDGSGANYQTDVNISGFPTGATIQNSSDINRICLSMEHSYLGDLEMMLTCPNGQSVMIFNSYSGNGLYPGGFGGGSTYIGGAFDGNTGTVGVCEEYCFSEQPGSLPAWINGYNTVPATGPSSGSMIEPGTYNPEESFIPALQGCPINGTWTITVRDNLAIDDGYICEWGIFFDATLNPNNETYTPTIVNEFWSPDPTILAGDNDTAVIVLPPLGTTGYVFNVEDNFGCHYDTTINVTAIPGPSISADSIGCMGDNVQFTNTYAPDGGNWSYTGPGNLSFSPNTTFINPSVSVDVPGTYTLIFMDNQCSDTVTQNITFLPMPTVSVVSEKDTICRGDSLLVMAATSDPNNTTWNTTPPTAGSMVMLSEGGDYTVTTVNQCGTASANFSLFIEDCIIPNVITPNGDGDNDVFYTNIADTYDDVHFTVFNRWGRKVYEDEAYKNTWGGKNNGGKDLAEGTYYYILTYSGGDKVEKGFITLFRK